MERTHVTMEQKVCKACGVAFSTGNILLATRVRNGKLDTPFEGSHTVSGWGLCPEHEAMRAEGRILIVGCNNAVSGTRLKLEDASRTGTVAAMRREAFERIFADCTPPADGIVFASPELMEWLAQQAAMANEPGAANHDKEPTNER